MECNKNVSVGIEKLLAQKISKTNNLRNNYTFNLFQQYFKNILTQ